MEDSVTEKVVIRPPEYEDIDRLLAIERRSFKSHRFTRKDFEYHLAHSSSIFLVAESAGQVVGYIAGVIYHGTRSKVARIYSMAVLPKWRNAGIGSLFLKHFERAAAKRAAYSATLEVRKTNRKAIDLYRRFGYKVERVLPDYYASGSDGLRMRKSLNSGRS